MKTYICIKECIMFRPWFDTPVHVQPKLDESGRPVTYDFATPPPEHVFRELGEEKPKPKTEPAGPQVDLSKRTRNELEQIALGYGIEDGKDAKKYPNKAKLIEAIQEAAAASLEPEEPPAEA